MKKQLKQIINTLKYSVFNILVKRCNIKYVLLFVLVTTNCQLAIAQLFPVQVNQTLIPPYDTKLNNYVTATDIKLRLFLTLNDTI